MREALAANPLVSGQPIVFVCRHQYARDHHATETMFQNGEINTASYQGGGAIRVFDLANGGRVRTIVDAGPSGVARDPELSFDGTRILFSMRRSREDDYHVYEVDIDGNNLRQLTFGEMVADIDPAYLPDGQIVFSSTRDVKYCQCNRHISPNLFRMDADGRNMLQIGHNNLPELHASLLADGRVLYDRWEYVDRQFGPSYGLWTCNPDGTNHALYYGSNAWSPGADHPGPSDSGQPAGGLHFRLLPRPAVGRADRSSTAGSAWMGRSRSSASGRPRRSSCSRGSTTSRWLK